jgi:hypothetical protein
MARLKYAGAVLVVKTNVATMLGDYQSSNPIFGRSNKPWNVERTPGGSSGGAAAALAAGIALVIGKEKKLVVPDRSAQTGAELVLLILRFGRSRFSEKILRVELGVAEKLVHAAVKSIRSGLGNHVDGRAGVPSLLGLKEICPDPHFVHDPGNVFLTDAFGPPLLFHPLREAPKSPRGGITAYSILQHFRRLAVLLAGKIFDLLPQLIRYQWVRVRHGAILSYFPI